MEDFWHSLQQRSLTVDKISWQSAPALSLTKEFGGKSQLLAGSLNCAYLCPFASVRSKRSTWHVYKEIEREGNVRRSRTRRDRAPLMPCALNQPIALSRTLSHVSLTRTIPLFLSSYLSISSSCSQRQPLHLRSVLIFGGALIYQRVYPSTTHTHPRSILHSLYPQHAHEHPTLRVRARSHTARRLSLSEKVPFLSAVPRQ